MQNYDIEHYPERKSGNLFQTLNLHPQDIHFSSCFHHCYHLHLHKLLQNHQNLQSIYHQLLTNKVLHYKYKKKENSKKILIP